jgi:hypothetical protein
MFFVLNFIKGTVAFREEELLVGSAPPFGGGSKASWANIE